MQKVLLFLAALSICKACYPKYSSSPKCACGVPLNKRRIIGGKPAAVDEYPWQVGLMRSSSDSESFCGGSLLSTTTVLTAAHCVDNFYGSLYVAFPNGDVSLQNAEKIAASIEIYPYWGQNPMPNNDFAILTLSKPVKFSDSIQPICLPDPNEDYVDKTATVTGWGRNDVNSGQASPTLMAVNLTVINNSRCEDYIKDDPSSPSSFTIKVTPSMICAFDVGKSGCHGDSGGPLITLNKDGSYFSQIGVVSFGPPACGGVSVYGRVTHGLYWIMWQVTGETCPPAE